MFLKPISNLGSKSEKIKVKISNKNELFYVEGVLSYKNHSVKHLLLKSRDNNDVYSIKNNLNGNKFKFEINLHENNFKLQDKEAVYDFYLLVEVPEKKLKENQKRKLMEKTTTYIHKDGIKVWQYELRLGRFKETVDLIQNPVIFANNKYLIYKTVKGNISLAINHEVKQEVITQIDQLKSGRHEIT